MVSDITMANVTGTAVTRSVPEPKTIEGPLEDVGLDVVVTTTWDVLDFELVGFELDDVELVLDDAKIGDIKDELMVNEVDELFFPHQCDDNDDDDLEYWTAAANVALA